MFESFPDQWDKLACTPKLGLCCGEAETDIDGNVVVANKTEDGAELLPP